MLKVQIHYQMFNKENGNFMIRAIDTGNVSIFANEAIKGQNYRCPFCMDELVLRQGRVRVHHFSHKVINTCPLAIRESAEHIEMKFFLFHALKQKYANVIVEAPLNNGIIDILLTDLNGQKYAIECQYSPITVREWEERNAYLNKHGMAVIWVWSFNRFTQYDIDEWKIPRYILHCHKMTYGKVYIFNHLSKRIQACNLSPVSRWKDEAYNNNGDVVGGYEYSLKTVRAAKCLESPLRPREILSSDKRYRLAELGEGVFWKKK